MVDFSIDARGESPLRRTRFAPSPTGYLHIGHGYAALAVEAAAERLGAEVILRIEDTDATRCKPEFTEAIIEDLGWLGFRWDALVVQSARLAQYRAALARLAADGLAYRCFCSRRDIAAAAITAGPEGPIYPGTCRAIDPVTAAARAETQPHGWRFDHQLAMQRFGPMAWHDGGGAEHILQPQKLAETLGDVLLASRDRPASYHLAVVVDDAGARDIGDAISDVVRGADLLLATDIHRLLQAALGVASPVYHHHGLLVDADGRKLAKSHGSLTLRGLRHAGISAEQLRDDLAHRRFPAGIRLDNA